MADNNQPGLLASMPMPIRQLIVLVAVAGAVAAGVMVAFWAREPNYSLLYGNLGEKDSANVLEGLGKASIPYKIDPATGAVLVPAAKVHEARLKLAGQGLPKGLGVGFELMDEKPGFGTTQLQETARYQRAMEGELARSIMAISSVQSARVHIAIPRASAFVRDREKSSASVVVNLYPGRSLESDQVAAITHLVAASVPNLSAERVTVIDQKGRLMTGANAKPEFSTSASQIEHTRSLEAAYAQRIEELLLPITGPGAIKAQVTADVDYTFKESTSESYDPQRTPVRSEQLAEESSTGGAAAGGVPGALSNSPPGPASAPEVTAKKPATGAPQKTEETQAAPPGNSSKRVTRNYEIDKTISHTRNATGTVRRLTIAVVVDDAQVPGKKKGTVTRTPRKQEELDRYTALVKEAVGFDEKRGDRVSVVNASFMTPAPVTPLPEEPLWKQEWVWDLGRQIGGGLAALIVLLMVVRPLLRALKAPPLTPMRQVAMLPEDQVSLGASRGPGGYEDKLNSARQVAAQDPKRVAQVVKGWVAADAG